MTQADLITILLKNRGLTTKAAIADFLNPPHPKDIPPKDVGLSKTAIQKADKLIKKHIDSGNKIAIYGDYDVDGLTSTAILWESIYATYKNVFPHIPHRRDEGYGLTKKGIDLCLDQGAKLIITVDNGITAVSEVDYCHQKSCDIIIIDHHLAGSTLPAADALLHSTVTSAAGLTWFFIREMSPSPEIRRGVGGEVDNDFLSLVAISAICDLVPLIGVNRSLAKFGLQELNTTNRPGLLALFKLAGIAPPFSTYDAGFVIGPRLNASGRLEHALDSLRLLCTTDPKRADELALHLHSVNKTRQDMTTVSTHKALAKFAGDDIPPILICADPEFDEGIVGLIASKLTEKYFRPAIAISMGDPMSKGSARSIPGVDITEELKQVSKYLTSVGGHSMAAGLSLETKNLDQFTQALLASASTRISPSLFVRNRKLDADLDLSLITPDLYQALSQFEPFGLGNPRPVFRSLDIPTSGARWLGQNANHLKFYADVLESIYFNAPRGMQLPENVKELIYSIDENHFNGTTRLQLLVKDIILT